MIANLLDDLDIETRPYQQRITTKAIEMFSGEHINRAGVQEPEANSVMIESPTGSGKTVMGLMVAKWLHTHRNYRIGWVAMRRNLLSQAAEENINKGFGIKEFYPISMFEKNPPEVDVLIVDEAQHDAAMSMNNLHSAIKPKKILGLTATPFRTDRIKLCFDKVIADAGIHQLIQEGYLARYHHYTIPEYTPSTVAETYLRDREHWGKTLFFFHKVSECRECQRLLAAGGVHAEIVTANSNREKQLEDFVSGKTDVLINMAILTEGFDCPALKTVFCRPSGKGCTIQMGGRVFRKHPDFPFKQIVQCQKTKHPFVKTATPEEQYVWQGDSWRSLKINRHITEISRRALRAIATTNVELPQLIVQNRERPIGWPRGFGGDSLEN